MSDPRIETGRGFNGSIRTDSNRHHYYKQAPEWALSLVGPRYGFRENWNNGMVWIFVAYHYAITLRQLEALQVPVAGLATLHILATLALGMVFILYYQAPKDIWVIVYRILLVCVGITLAIGLQGVK